MTPDGTSTTTHFGVHPLRMLLASSGISLIVLALAADLLPDSAPGLGIYQVSGLIIGAGILLAALVIRKLSFLIAAVIVIAAVGSPPVVDQVYDPPIPLKDREWDALQSMVPDERLVRVIPPYAGGHDANGFRNDSVPDRATIVAIGDSQTWGINAKRDETWPSVLADLTGQTVYNMGMGGYGPIQYWVLTGDALDQFDPDTIIIGFYFGNDLYDAYRIAYRHEPYYSLRDESLVETLAEDTIEWQAEEAYANVKRIRYESDTNGTVFLPEYRAFAVNLDDLRIAEGMRISKIVLSQIAEQVRAADKRLIILLIPTKEIAYLNLVPQPVDPVYERLIDLETDARALIMAFLDEQGIEYVDSLPALQAHLEAGEALYPTSPDGHPAPAGYRVIAEAANAYLADTAGE